MLQRTIPIIVLVTGGALGAISIAAARSATPHPDPSVVHEWGTFTTVAGPDGRAIEWVPLGGPSDLPCFVQHLGEPPAIPGRPVAGAQRVPITKYVAADGRVQVVDSRTPLRAKVRMETPVLYFYGPRDASIDVRVRFPHGVVTEWYPQAKVSNPAGVMGTLQDPKQSSVIEWKNVALGVDESTRLPLGGGESHYYAARNTDATILHVGNQAEKFLFYRGVANFDVPVAAKIQPNGDVLISNLSSTPIAAAVLLDVHDGRLGYRVSRELSGQVTLPAPQRTGSLTDLRAELEKALVDAGLYAKEAAAMVDTWRDSWFEEGTRVFYLVPPRAVDAILPMEIRPTPASVTRTFVGRMELLTPRAERDVEGAIARGDAAALERYGRFLAPITDRLLASETDNAARARIKETAGKTFDAFIAKVSTCQ